MLASPTENKNVLFTHDPLLILSLPRVLRVDLNFSLSFVPQPLQFDSFCGKAIVDPYFAKSTHCPVLVLSHCLWSSWLFFLFILLFSIVHSFVLIFLLTVFSSVLTGSFFHLPFLGSCVYSPGFPYRPRAGHASTVCLVLTPPLYLTRVSSACLHFTVSHTQLSKWTIWERF